MGTVSKILEGLFGNKHAKDIKALQPVIDKIKAFGAAYESLSNDELRGKTTALRDEIKKATADSEDRVRELEATADRTQDVDEKESIYREIDKLKQAITKVIADKLNTLLPQAFAVVRETARRFANDETLVVTATAFDRVLSSTRDMVGLAGDKAIWKNSWDAAGKKVTWDMVHYDVQLIGGIVLHQGKAAEMATGEGKTLVATLPIYLNALAGKGVHLVTVNDYLAKRDSAWMGPLFEFHGLSVGCIDWHEANSKGRRQAYAADITYGTNNEFGFDYLRDNMAHAPADLVQRGHNYAIVDEVDSVLIDDARTPLIISGPVSKSDTQEFDKLKPKVEKVFAEQRKYLTNTLAESKKSFAEGDEKEGGFKLLRVFRGLPKNKALIKFLSEEGIRARLQKTENHYMRDNNREMPKVDEELYFVIDEKNNSIELTDKGAAFLSKDIADKAFFIMPDIGMEIAKIENAALSDTEKADRKDSLFRDYSIKSERIHTLNQLLRAYTLFERDVEYVVLDGKVKIVDEQTGRIMEGRRYAEGLHQAIEAKESVTVEEATQTLATVTLQNYFRMYDKLAGMTGTAETEAAELWEIYKLDVVVIPTNRPIVRMDKADIIYKTKREKYSAIIDEVVALTEQNRPVLVGTTNVEVSELLSRMLKIKKIPHDVLNAKRHKREADIIAEAGKPGKVTIATNMAGRGTDIQITDGVKEAGGLAIIGTERHDSRRVDRQLRGRSGRQGDPGTSQFYISLEDNLMRLFGSERLAKVMDRLGLKDGEMIQHNLITKSIARAQKKVEENNFGIRKRLLEYDDVMNSQREVIYKRRHHALFGDRLSIDIANVIWETAHTITSENKPTNDFAGFKNEVIRSMAIDTAISGQAFEKKSADELARELYDTASVHREEKNERNARQAMPVIASVLENQGDRYERIAVPFSDGVKTMQVVTDLKRAYETQGVQLIQDFEKSIALALIDENWKTHLREMDELRSAVQNAVYEQKDPLLIYKFESFNLFSEMIDTVNREMVSFLFKGEVPDHHATDTVRQAHEPRRERIQLGRGATQDTSPPQTGADQRREVTTTEPRSVTKIGRNERVQIRAITTGEVKELKYKQAQPLIEKGEWVLED